MLQSIVLQLVLSYLASALTAAEGAIDWAKIQAELDAKLKAVLPGWIEGEAQLVLDNAVKLVQGVAGAPGVVEKLISLVVAKNFEGVVSYLEQLVMGQLQPVGTTSVQSSVEAVKAYKEAV